MRDLTGGRGADIVFDFVGTDQTHAASAEMLARGGTYSVIGYGGTISIPSGALVVNEHAVVGNLVGTWIDLWELLQLHAAGKVTLKTETHPLGLGQRGARQAAGRRDHGARSSRPVTSRSGARHGAWHRGF